MPYAGVYAHRRYGAFVNTYNEASDLVIDDSDVSEIVYFGDDSTLASLLSTLASDYCKSFQQVSTIADAEIKLTPANLSGTQNIVTIIHEGTDASIVRLNKLLQYTKKERKELVAAVIDRRTDIVYYILDSIEFDSLKAPWLKNNKSS